MSTLSDNDYFPEMILEGLTSDESGQFGTDQIAEAHAAASGARSNAMAAARYSRASLRALMTNQPVALEIIARRAKARTAARNQPLSAAAKRALRCED